MGVTQAIEEPLTVMLNAPLIEAGVFDWSATCTVKSDVPAVPVGVPVMTPDVLMARPAGRDPADMVNVFVPLPPATTIGVLGYVVPVEAAASAPGVVVNVIGGFSVTATLLVLVGSLTLATVMVEVVAEETTGAV